MEKYKIKFTTESEGVGSFPSTKISVEVPGDLDIYQMAEAFKSFLRAMGYMEESIQTIMVNDHD